MPKTSVFRVPQPSRHKASGQSVVRLNGRDFYLGPHGSSRAKAAYERLIGKWLTDGRQLPVVDSQDALSIEEILARYWGFAEQHYRKDGQPTEHLVSIRYALRPLQQLYGDTPADAFGPLALKAVRAKMIEAGLARKVINQRIGQIQRVFRWAVSEELIPATVIHALSSVRGLQRGRTEARETEPILPVADEVVNATLPFLTKVVADMVRFQRLTGTRPGEVCAIRPCDVDRSGEIWIYRPRRHKTDHLGRERLVFIGPRAQEVLRPYLLRGGESPCFSPAESVANQRSRQRARRKTKVQPSQVDRRKPNPKRKPRDSYDRQAYLHAIRRACRKADVAAHKEPENAHVPRVRVIIPYWHPNQLRHTAATEIRSKLGLEAAQVALGHSKADVTQIYAERDWAKAADVMRQIG